MVVEPPRKRKGRFNILSFFALIIFFGSILLAVGVFFLERNHAHSLELKKADLAGKRAEFKQDTIDSIRALDTRVRTAEYLMNNHVSPSLLLATLERTTQEHIQYTSFDFSRRPSGNISVSLTGIAPRFNTVARQKERLEADALFNRVIFSNLDKPEPEHVSFKVDLDITKDAIAYDAPEQSVADIIENTASTTDATAGGEAAAASDTSTNPVPPKR